MTNMRMASGVHARWRLAALLAAGLLLLAAQMALAAEQVRLLAVRVAPVRVAGAPGAEVVLEVSRAISFDAGVQAAPLRLEMVIPGLDDARGRGGGKAVVHGSSPLAGQPTLRRAQGGLVLRLPLKAPALIVDAHAEPKGADGAARLVVRLARTDAATLARLLGVPEARIRQAGNARQGSERLAKRHGAAAPAQPAGPLDKVKAAYRKLVEEAAATPTDIGDLIKALPRSFDEGKATGEKPAPGRATVGAARAKAADAGAASASSPASGGTDGGTGGGSGGGAGSGPAERPVIVVDAGHGGKDPGAMNSRGVKEKDIVLKFAHALRKALQRRGYRVVMTRAGDTFLKLRQRVQVARAHHAALFVSIHVDKFRRGNVKGLGIYTLSEQASDADAAALARMENAADLIGAPEDEIADDKVRDILVDLTQRETNATSHLLATRLVRSLRGVVPLRRNPVRSAAFRVLRAPEIPSLLIELGYITNPRDVRNMLSRAWRRRAAARMASTIDRLLKERLALR